MCKADCAVQCFNNGFNCAQAVFSTYSESLGLESETALKVAGAFGGGMGHIGETCGAVTGAFMLIGLKYGKFTEEDSLSKEKTYTLVKEFTRRFKELHGSVRCTELLGYDLSTPEGFVAARESNVWSTLCSQYVKSAAGIVEDILELK